MFKRLLIANRGEIAIRIARTAADLNIASTMIYSEDDAASLHVRAGDAALALSGAGPSAYLDGPQILRLALETGCDAIHPGYGFLSESAAFARLCNNAGVAFVGPAPETLNLLGDKAQARALATRIGAPVLPGIDRSRHAGGSRAVPQQLGQRQRGHAEGTRRGRRPRYARGACTRRKCPPRSNAAAPRRCKPLATATCTSSSY